MKPDSTHIKRILVVSNTHWDREFRWSFEKTRRRLLTMMDTTLDILQNDDDYPSFTMDGHCVMIDDYLEMRPERREQVERFIQQGRLIIGPWFTLAEEFSIGQEALVRNFLFGQKTIRKYGGKPGTVAYTPSSWGQTGQLPQILADFGLTHMMFYRGISHHESDAEWIWEGSDGTQMLASRFALYARYNWYYQVHRPVMTGRVFTKDYVWGEREESPMRPADGMAGEDIAFSLLNPALEYHPERVKQAVEDMVEREGAHFTTDLFLAMHGHDISVAHPLESRILADAKKQLAGKYEIKHTNLEEFWSEFEKCMDREKLPVLRGERRSYLKQGMWTFLFPGTISARTYLKQQDFSATNRLVNYAEPLASLAHALGMEYPARYMARGWRFLISNHTHDANGGCAPDPVCKDMEYGYRKAQDIGDIVSEDSMAHIVKNLTGNGVAKDAMQLVVFNPQPFERNVIIHADLEIPNSLSAKSVTLESDNDKDVERQPISMAKGGSFVDSIWDVPTILDSTRMKFYAKLNQIPALGYRAYNIKPQALELRNQKGLVNGPNTMSNDEISVDVLSDGTVNIYQKDRIGHYGLNYLQDQGEVGNAWKHVTPSRDRVYNSIGSQGQLYIMEDGPLSATIAVDYTFAVPMDYADGDSRSETMVDLPVHVEYTLQKGCNILRVKLTVDNRAKDHVLRACFPTTITTDVTIADSHFDILERPITIPDSTGWVEPACGTHPLRTFVDISDGSDGLAILPAGLFEYEAFEDVNTTLALTLIRACRIKLAVSEEKQAELPDPGVQCPGVQTFEYGILAHEGDWKSAKLLNQATALYTPVRAMQTGRGQGDLPGEFSMFTSEGPCVITAIKGAEDVDGLIIRLYNPSLQEEISTLRFNMPIKHAHICRMDESTVMSFTPDGLTISAPVQSKKIVTLKVEVK